MDTYYLIKDEVLQLLIVHFLNKKKYAKENG